MTSPNMASPGPIYSDRYRGTATQLMNPVIGLILVGLGVWGAELVTTLLGVGLLLVVWFTRHAYYEIFPDNLLIHYGRPRRKVLPLADIQEVILLKSPWGVQELFVKRKTGRGMFIRPRDAEQFLQRLEDARGRLAR